MEELFSRPFDELEPGARFTSRGRTITEADIVGFASLSGDWHPLHTDAAWAAASPFGERVAHGLLLVSMAVGLLPLDPERVVALRRVEDAVFKRPAYIGDTVHADGRIGELTPADARAGLVTLAWSVRNQHGQTLVRAKTQLLWSRDHDPAGDEPAPAELPALAGVFPL